ncbi:TVP38/TMEM64 family protein [Halobacillus campisalis]|uniref:TVP38/TMEM64 family membrane protein n=1 Tax=Halobacillus campisalis TaxID=435909 RepID=A0ABW2K6N9_9BACI|nr:VTT domain-containing protein [Halobacillus campisalis]
MNRAGYTLRLLTIGILISAVIYFIHFRWDITPNDIQLFITSFGWMSPFIFILAYMIGPFIMFPSSVLSMSAGLAYGMWPGILYIWIGAGGAATTGYIIGRFFGKSILRLYHYQWSQKAEEKINERGFLFVLFLRLVPIIGFSLLSYLSGMMKLRFSSYLMATMIGILPGVFTYGTVGASIIAGDPIIVGIAIIMVVLLMMISYLNRNRVKKWLGLDSDREE